MHLKGYMLAQKNKEQRKINILKNILKRINPTEISNVMLWVKGIEILASQIQIYYFFYWIILWIL